MKALIRILFFILNIALVALLLCCIATRYINPNYITYFEIIGIAFPFIFLANCIAVVFWLLAKDHKYYCIYSLITVLMAAPIANDYYELQKKEITDTEGIKIISYNVNTFGIEGWKNRTSVQKRIYNYIEKEKPDIICFQEFHHDQNEQFKFLDKIKKLGLKHIHKNAIHSVGPQHFQGNCICSRYPIINTGIMRYQKGGNCTIWADIVYQKDTIRIFNNHLESYRLTESNLQIVDEIAKDQTLDKENAKSTLQKLQRAVSRRGVQTDELIHAINESPYPIICCGDFNSLPCSYTYQSIQKSQDLRDAFLESGAGLGDSFNKKWWSRFRLDYILYSPTLSSEDFQRTKIQASDHYPIGCKIVISE